MSESLLALVVQSLWLGLWLVLPLLVAAVVGGALAGIFAAITQIQDPSIGLALRLAAMAAAGVAFAPLWARHLSQFGQQVLVMVGRVGQGGG